MFFLALYCALVHNIGITKSKKSSQQRITKMHFGAKFFRKCTRKDLVFTRAKAIIITLRDRLKENKESKRIKKSFVKNKDVYLSVLYKKA